MKTTTTIQGMHCNSCATLITMNLEELDGIQSVDINKDS
ncbi:MAG: heavy-metal-associated domain-containing protein [Candidatus Peribacteria bacterium]|nr:MAG: heavy-metal-associated domain-containing protein [Candidatus Peribacteria bacterium]